MRIRFLGTGPSRAIPRRGHTDALCRDARAGGRSRRTRSSALLTTEEGRRILLDAGPDVRAQLEDAGRPALDAILLTHAHDDAVAGIGALDRGLDRPTPLHAHPTTCRRVRARFGPLRHVTLRALTSTVRFGRTGVRAILVPHSLQPGFPTHAFRVGARFAYASDVARIPPAAARALRSVHTLALDAAMWGRRRMPSHLDLATALRAGIALRVRRLVLTHLGHSCPPHGEAEREALALLERFAPRHPLELRLAYDGLELDL